MQSWSGHIAERVRLAVARIAVAFGAACTGMFTGLVGGAVAMPAIGPTAAAVNLVFAAGIGLAVTGAVASLAVPVRPGDF